MFFVKDELPPMVQTVGVTTPEGARRQRGKIAQAGAGARRGPVAFLYAHPEEAAKIVAKQYEADEKTILSAINNLIAMKYWSDGSFEYDAMDHMVKGLQIVSEGRRQVDWSKIVDESYLK